MRNKALNLGLLSAALSLGDSNMLEALARPLVTESTRSWVDDPERREKSEKKRERRNARNLKNLGKV